MRKNCSESGQTLIEILIAITLIVFVLTSLASGLSLGVRNSRFSANASTAKDRITEAQEWVRSVENQAGWESFYQMVSADNPPVTYCLTSLPTSVQEFDALIGSNCLPSETIPNTVFSRAMTLTVVSPTAIDSLVTISWIDSGKAQSVSTTTRLTQHE
ncbi:MAG TPA: type II secretion system protein [Patescibacteria group bacterium]|nr:type II secretion system protein [Patescibacteria group bacterium]